MFRRILVTLDGSAFAEAALPAAAALARRSGGELRLLTVEDSGFELVTDSGWTVEVESGEAKGKTYLEDVHARTGNLCADVTTTLRFGYPADEIMKAADEFDADLIVMATHGRGALSRLWLGSVANECVRHAHRPMLLIRPDGDAKADGLREASLALHRILVPLDGSELSERALGPAAVFANLFGSRITLMRVVHELTFADREFFPENATATDAIVELERADALAYLERVALPIREWGPAIDTYTAPAVDVAGAIVDKAAGHLVVMATHARSGFGSVFLGSVTEAVIRAARGPVMVIPPLPRALDVPAPVTNVDRLIDSAAF
jgi:nucleotide-binding universal stress UspA family protein